MSRYSLHDHVLSILGRKEPTNGEDSLIKFYGTGVIDLSNRMLRRNGVEDDVQC